MKTPEQIRIARRKSKLRMNFKTTIDAEINKTMEKVMLLCEIKCDLRNEGNEARAKPIRDAFKAGKRAARLARRKPKTPITHDEWGKEIS